MYNLISHPINDAFSFSIQGDLLAQGTELLLEFCLGNVGSLFDLPSQDQSWPGDQVPRRDGLWQGICFEAFLNPIGVEKYYELNLALNPAWNVYEFSTYRQPQPPTATHNFELESLSWDCQSLRLSARVQNHSPYRQFRVGLSAVLLERGGEKHYAALAHAGEKPDFHLNKSFILQRGSKI